MSGVANVMMGILGSTITIGLASVGGMSLAPRYEEARQTATAAHVMTALVQTGAAVTMARATGGQVGTGREGMVDLVRQGWLSSLPVSPTTGAMATLEPAPDGSSYVQMRLADADGRVCDEIAREAGMASAPVADVAPMAPYGCIRTSQGSLAFARI